MKKIRILIADDHQVVRKGIRAVLDGRAEWEICGEAANGREAVAAAARLKPDLVIMDIAMPEMNGVEATRQILQHHPRIQILIVSMYESERLVRDVLVAGARGYLLKSDASDDLIAAVEALCRHKLWFTSKITDVVLRGYLDGLPPLSGRSNTPTDVLSPRQREIVQLVAEGRSNKEIAETLEITIKTVETHRAHIMAKLDLHSISDLVRYAIRNAIIEC
jgi:DNA-binding NarL/FixJ family response regulator